MITTSGMKEITLGALHDKLKPRPADGHKGTFGHALLIAGKYGMAGACILASRAFMRSGAGKLTVHIPRRNNDIMQVTVPEAVIQHDSSPVMFTQATDLIQYKALGIGPGLGTEPATATAVHDQLLIARHYDTPTVIDADALNILSMNPGWWKDLPDKTIITPHSGEFARLQKSGIDFSRVTLVMKGHGTTIAAQGQTYLCPWGNSGMATAGSGDVLTGIILGFLAQGYDTADAAILGVSFHALAGDKAASLYGQYSMTASDIADNLKIM